MESPSRSRSLRSLAVVLLLTLAVLIGLNHLVASVQAQPASDQKSLPISPHEDTLALLPR